jgi:hypothetical protein
MREDSDGLKEITNGVLGVFEVIEAFETAPSEEAQAVIVRENMIPWVRNTGICPSIAFVLRFLLLANPGCRVL